jgi:hypothetical protein
MSSCGDLIPFDVLIEVCRFGGDKITLRFGLTCKRMKRLIDERVRMNRILTPDLCHGSYKFVYSNSGHKRANVIGKYTRLDLSDTLRLPDGYHSDVEDLSLCNSCVKSLPPKLKTLVMVECKLISSDDSNVTYAPKDYMGYGVGMHLFVYDAVHHWEEAIILEIKGENLYIGYIEWSSKWNEWIHSRVDYRRIRLTNGFRLTQLPETLETLNVSLMKIRFPLPDSIRVLSLTSLRDWDIKHTQWPSSLTHLTLKGFSDPSSMTFLPRNLDHLEIFPPVPPENDVQKRLLSLVEGCPSHFTIEQKKWSIVLHSKKS